MFGCWWKRISYKAVLVWIWTDTGLRLIFSVLWLVTALDLTWWSLTLPYCHIASHCHIFGCLLITLDFTWWSLTLPEMMCSSLKLSLNIGSFGESLSFSVRYFSSFFGTCVSTPSAVSGFPRALLWIPASHSYFTNRLLDCFQNYHFVTIITLLHEEETITNLVPHFSGQQQPQQLQEPITTTTRITPQ